MLSTSLLRASRSTRARRVVESWSVAGRVVDRFVAGHAVGDAVRATTKVREGGAAVSIDVLGEDVTDLASAVAIRDTYLDLIAALADAGLSRGVDLSVKLSALGQALPDGGHDVSTHHAHEICGAAADAGATVTLDMEDHTTTDATLHAGQTLRSEFPMVGNVLQSNLLRTPADIEALSGSRARIRLVKGAYREPAGVAHQQKKVVDLAYRSDMAQLFAGTCYPMIATHDPTMLEHAANCASTAGHTTEDWEAQMLFGVRTDLQRKAIDAGQKLRVYIPFGSDWYGYFMRRLAERPANVAFFLRAVTKS